MRRPCLLLLPPALALAVVLLACGGGSGPAGDAGGEGETAPFGLETRRALLPLAFPDGLPEPGDVGLERAFPILDFARPVLLTAAPDGSSWVYVVEQAGRVLVFENDDDVTTATTFLDLRGPSGPVSRAGNEEGLLGLAFDPEFGRGNGRFWIHYSAANPRRSVIARYEATFPASGPPVAQGGGTVIFEVAQPYSNHNGGMLAFGPDGMLYVGLGDGGSANDPQDNGQDRSTLLATILRLDVRGQATYAIPSDNPFVGQSGARGEIWAWGLRNPWRFSFDRGTGDLWVGDVGQGQREEVALVGRGENHGWPVYEGFRSHQNPGGVPPSAFTSPILDYERSTGTCVIGGIVYRGADVPSLLGHYVYGDYGSGRIFALRKNGDVLERNEQIAQVAQVASFGEDHRGELYALSLGGAVWRFVEVGGTGPKPFPQTLSMTGLFTNTATLTPNPGLVEYDVNAPLFSDGTFKRRWIALPNGATLGFDAAAPWDFPRGTVLVKHFELAMRTGDVSSRRRLETRVLIFETEGWRGYTYRWNAAQTDADLLPGGVGEDLLIEDASAPGGTRTQRYEYPSRTDCLRCHTAAAGFVLGVRTRQLNRSFEYPAARDNQLRSWNHIGLFGRDIGAASGYEAQVDPADDGLPVAARARSYLDANCAFCHQPTGPAPGDLDLRLHTTEAAMHAIDVRPTEGDLGLPEAWRVLAGDRASSVLYERMRRRGAEQMPPLASNVVDAAAVELVGRWIDGL